MNFSPLVFFTPTKTNRDFENVRVHTAHLCVCVKIAARNDILMSKISGWINIYLLEFVWHSEKVGKYVKWAKALLRIHRNCAIHFVVLLYLIFINFCSCLNDLYIQHVVINMVHHFQYIVYFSEMNFKCIYMGTFNWFK